MFSDVSHYMEMCGIFLYTLNKFLYKSKYSRFAVNRNQDKILLVYFLTQAVRTHLDWRIMTSYLCHLSLNSCGLQRCDSFLSRCRTVKVNKTIAYKHSRTNKQG